MIDFTGQSVIVTGAGRGLGRLYALDVARRGAAVVVNDLGSTMHGDGVDSSVADSVVEEITSSGGRAVASYDSVDTAAGGGAAIVDAAMTSFGRSMPSSATRASSAASPSTSSRRTIGRECCGSISMAAFTCHSLPTG